MQLTSDQKRRLDEVGQFRAFKNSEFRQLLAGMLDSYVEEAMQRVKDYEGGNAHEAFALMQVLHARMDVVNHIELSIDEKIGQLETVAAEVGVSVGNLHEDQLTYGG